MRNSHLICVVGLGVALASAQCSLSKPASIPAAIRRQQRVLSQELGKLERANPSKDLQKALRKKDFRFIGYYGFTLFVPGVEGQTSNRHVRAHGVKAIKGTSDVITMREYKRLQSVVQKYVVPYNKALLNHLKRTEKEIRSK